MVAKLFRKESDAVDSFKMDRSDPDVRRQMDLVDKRLAEHFHGPRTSGLKLAIILIPDAEAREQLLAIMRAYAQSLAVEGGLAGVSSSFITGSILQVGNQISAAYARGERPGDYEMGQYKRFTTWPPGRRRSSSGVEPSAPLQAGPGAGLTVGEAGNEL